MASLYYHAARALLGAALLTLTSVHAFAAPPLAPQVSPPDCSAAVEAAKSDWRSLSHGVHVAPRQRILTSDGRHLTGSDINYAKVLIDRAEEACSGVYHREARV
jgi:hypothetical protein